MNELHDDVLQMQCYQIARLFAQYLVIYVQRWQQWKYGDNNEYLPM